MEAQNDLEKKYASVTDEVLGEIGNAIRAIDCSQTGQLIKDICSAEKVFLVGVGRVMLSLQAITKRFSHIGVRAFCVGDVTEPAITEKDILIVASGSGESIIPIAIAKKAKDVGCKKVVQIGSNPNGSIRMFVDYIVRIPVRTRLYLDDEIDSAQIMTSLFEQSLLIYGDIIAKLIVEEKGIDMKELWEYHANLE